MKDQKSATRDSYGKIDYINVPYLNTGSVGNIDTKYVEQDKNLHESLQETSDLLDEIFKKNKIQEQIISGKF